MEREPGSRWPRGPHPSCADLAALITMAPLIHHLNCGSMCPVGQRFFNGEGSRLGRGKFVCHVLLLERSDGLVLIDTGMGTSQAADPKLLGIPFRAFSPRPTMAETAVVQVKRLGFDPTDLRHIVLTHIDLDHAGGLGDFPAAEVHVFAREHDAFRRPPLSQRYRYKLSRAAWTTEPRWVAHELAGDRWQGFDSVRILPGQDPDVLLVPLSWSFARTHGNRRQARYKLAPAMRGRLLLSGRNRNAATTSGRSRGLPDDCRGRPRSAPLKPGASARVGPAVIRSGTSHLFA